jgi:hypothetical protein
MRRIALSLVIFAAGCGSEDPNDPGPDGGIADRACCDGGSPDAGEEEQPLLSRPLDRRYTCTASKPATDLSPRIWFGADPTHALVASGTTAWSARFESEGQSPFEPPTVERRLVLSSVGADGTFSAPRMIEREGHSVSMVADARGFGLAWTATAVHVAFYDPSGDVRVAPKVLASTMGEASQAQLAASANGYGLVYGWKPDPDATGELYFLRLDQNGDEMGAPLMLARSPLPYRELGGKIVATQDGYGVIWSAPGQTAQKSDVYFARIDLQGNLQGQAQKISNNDRMYFSSGSGIGFERAQLALITRGDGFLAAWTEAYDNGLINDRKGAYGLTRIAELDREGRVTAGPHPLQRRELHVDQVEPSLLPFGDSIAVLWGKGTHIYLCGGCVPDHSIQLVLLDPATLSPRSDVVSIPPTNGGLLRRAEAVIGDQILMTLQITFHVSANPGVAAFRCQ